MGGGSADKPSSDSIVIAEAVKELQDSNIKLQEGNAKATKKYLIITVIATFVSTISGILIGKLVLV